MKKTFATLALAGMLGLSACSGNDDKPAAPSASSSSAAATSSGSAQAPTSAAPATSEAPAGNGGGERSDAPADKAALIKAVTAAEKGVKSVHTELVSKQMKIVQDHDIAADRRLNTMTYQGKTTSFLTVGKTDYEKKGSKWQKVVGIAFVIDANGAVQTVIEQSDRVKGFKKTGDREYELTIQPPKESKTKTPYKVTVEIDEANRITTIKGDEFTVKRSKFDQDLKVPKP